MWAGIAALVGAIIAAVSNKQQAVRQENFQERMSNTAHQREVSDLRAAGLNPLLSGTGGVGATTPQGSKAEIGNLLQPAVSTAMQKKRLDAEVEVMDEQAKNMRLQGTNIYNDTLLKMAQEKATLNQSALTAASAHSVRLQQSKLENLSDVEKSSMGKILAPIDRVLQTIGLGSKPISTIEGR